MISSYLPLLFGLALGTVSALYITVTVQHKYTSLKAKDEPHVTYKPLTIPEHQKFLWHIIALGVAIVIGLLASLVFSIFFGITLAIIVFLSLPFTLWLLDRKPIYVPETKPSTELPTEPTLDDVAKDILYREYTKKPE